MRLYARSLLHPKINRINIEDIIIKRRGISIEILDIECVLGHVIGVQNENKKCGYNSMTRITNTILSPSIPNLQYIKYLNGRLTLTLITRTALAVAYHGIITKNALVNPPCWICPRSVVEERSWGEFNLPLQIVTCLPKKV